MQTASFNFMAISAIAVVVPGTALADVSALEVWENWKNYAETFGQTIEVGQETTDGGTLILDNVQMAMEFPEGSVSGVIETLEFQERGDGTVAVTMSPEMTFAMSAEPETGESFDMSMVIRQSGTSIIASGDDGEVVYDYLAAELGIDIDQFVIDGQDLEPTMSFTMRDIDGKYSSAEGDENVITSEVRAAAMDFAMAFDDPESGGSVDMTGSVQNLVSNSLASMPSDFTMDDPAQFFDGSFNVQGGYSTGAGQYSMHFVDGEDDFTMQGTTESSSLDFSFLDGSVEYGGTTTGAQYQLSSPAIPIPEIAFGVQEAAFNILMPLAQSEDMSDFGMLINFSGLEISETIWGLFDPGAVLPREPATFIIDVAGQMNWLLDITNPESTENFDGSTPAELHNLAINDVTVSAAGASVMGGGDFTFDNTDLETFDGLPAPSGTVVMNIAGINGLLDNLTAMGLLPDDQAMGARMMIGLFARPADGDDQWVSEIEVRGDGSVFANGQQLQ